LSFDQVCFEPFA